MLSVILPSYNEEKAVLTAVETIGRILDDEDIDCEILLIDDGSRDRTWEKICEASHANRRIRGCCFSRNFGKEAAIFAGLEQAVGDCCVVLDCDLQHPAQKIVEMYRLWEQGYEVVEGVKESRGKERAAHTVAAGAFYRIMSKATGFNMADASDFKLLDRKVVDALRQMPEYSVFFRALSHWVGFRKATVEYSVQPRIAGQSKWSTGALIRYALTNITSFSSAPLQVVTFLGCLMLLVSVVLGAIALIQKCIGVALSGFTTVIIIQLFTGSIVMISLGIIGLYIAKIYDECKGRPKYIISKTCGEECRDW